MSVSVHDEAPAASRSPPPVARDGAAPRPGIGSTDLLLASMALIWSVNFSVIKYGTRFVEPLAYNAARIALGAAAALAALAFWRRGSGQPVTPSRTRFFLLGMLGNGLYQFFFIEGLARSRVATAVLLMASTPAAIAMLGRIRGVERIALRGWIGIAFQLSGVAVLLIGTGAHRGTDSIAGAMLILGGVFAWAIYALALKPIAGEASWLEVMAYTLSGGAVVSAALGAPAIARAAWESAPFALWPAIAYSGIGALFIATAFWYEGLRRLGPTRTSMYSNLQPLFAMAIAWAALGEVPTQWQGLGALLVMSGLLLARA
ncbi:MAG: DMT family transporter [Gemmatimonadaceae bacterium]